MKKNRTFRAKVLRENAEINLAPNPVTADVYDGVTIDLDCHGWPTIHKGMDGTLYAVSSVRKTHMDPYGAIGMTQSSDGGQTWTPYRIIIDTPLDDRDCGIVDLGGGHLMVWWFSPDATNYLGKNYRDWYYYRCNAAQRDALLKKMESIVGTEAALGGSFVSHSYDGGKTWGERMRVPVSSPHGPTLMNDGKTLLSSGHYYFSERYDGNKWVQPNIYAVISKDSGYTWEVLASLPRPKPTFGCPCEPHILQLKDGTILLAYRDNGNGPDRGELKTSIARSEDGGKTWSEFERVLTANGGPPHLYQLNDGKVLLTYGCRTAPACGERCVISEDGGKTWSNEMVLSVAKAGYCGDLGYPSSTQLDDGTILSLYYQRLDNNEADDDKLMYAPSLLLTKWNLIEEAGWYEDEE
ncbi:MAG: exo-alpha-sialidase [Clostridia bacterium]|nr:exo-alpha-sialidase [Clostridia bacterium]